MRPALVALGVGRAADAGRDDGELRAAAPPDDRDLLRRCDHAVEAGGLRQRRQPLHLAATGRVEADLPSAPR